MAMPRTLIVRRALFSLSERQRFADNVNERSRKSDVTVAVSSNVYVRQSRRAMRKSLRDASWFVVRNNVSVEFRCVNVSGGGNI
jgi:hypothetical protein